VGAAAATIAWAIIEPSFDDYLYVQGTITAIGDEISDKALVRWEVAKDPAAAVDEEETRQSAGAAGRTHDGEAHL